MPDIVEWPGSLRITDRADPHLAQNTRSGGVSLAGTEQILSPLSERWEWAVTVALRDAASVRGLRILKSKLKGRFNYVLLRLCDQYRITRRDVGAVGVGPIPHSDGSLFSDLSGYNLAQPISPVTVAAARNATSLTVRASDFGGYMSAGVFFSIDFRPYQVDDWELVGSNYVLQISPPLRAAVAIDDEADFSAPSLWQLATDDEGRTDLRAGRLGTATLNLVEPVGR